MATAVHDSTLQDITSSTSFQTTVAEPPLRSKSCGPDVGRESAGSVTKKDDMPSSSTVSVKADNDTKSSSETGIAVSESKSATAITSTKPKIFDNKIFVEAPIPKTNPWLKSSAKPVNNNKGETHDSDCGCDCWHVYLLWLMTNNHCYLIYLLYSRNKGKE